MRIHQQEPFSTGYHPITQLDGKHKEMLMDFGILKLSADMEFEDGCFLVFGKETKGLPKPLIEANMETCMRIPMLKLEKARSLNLSNSVAIVVYEAMRQIGYPGMR